MTERGLSECGVLDKRRQEFETFLQKAKPGDRFVYHTGQLDYDRYKHRTTDQVFQSSVANNRQAYLREKNLRSEQVSDIAALAWQAFRTQWFDLTQKRLGDSMYAYYCIRRETKGDEWFGEAV